MLRNLSSLCIRVAKDIKGIGQPLLPQLCVNGRLLNTLVIAPPGAGKTTLLRDLIRCISNGAGISPMRVGVVDERGELAGMRRGVYQFDLGARTDILDSCPKEAGLFLLMRSMNPQLLAVDEITKPEDVYALSSAAGCGIGLLASVHGTDIKDLTQRDVYRELLRAEVFKRAVVIGAECGHRFYRVEAISC